MKKAYRIKKNQDFSRIIKKRKSIANKDFILYYLKNDSHLRVGLSVSKKLGNAVTRNKIKRQLRMMAQDLFNKEDQADYIIIVRNHYLTQTFEENKKSLQWLYKKSKKGWNSKWY